MFRWQRVSHLDCVLQIKNKAIYSYNPPFRARRTFYCLHLPSSLHTAECSTHCPLNNSLARFRPPEEFTQQKHNNDSLTRRLYFTQDDTRQNENSREFIIPLRQEFISHFMAVCLFIDSAVSMWRRHGQIRKKKIKQSRISFYLFLYCPVWGQYGLNSIRIIKFYHAHKMNYCWGKKWVLIGLWIFLVSYEVVHKEMYKAEGYWSRLRDISIKQSKKKCFPYFYISLSKLYHVGIKITNAPRNDSKLYPLGVPGYIKLWINFFPKTYI